MPRWIRLLVGAVLALILVGFLAQGVQWVYVHYAKSAESGLVGLLEYLFTPRKTPPAPTPAPGPLSESDKVACASGEAPNGFFPSSLGIYARLYSRKLCEAGELPLSRPGGGLARVRLLRAPTFDAGRVVRVEHSQVGNQMFVTEFPGLTKRSKRKTESGISGTQWTRIEQLLDEVSFWSLPSDGGAPDGPDGTAVLLEVSEPDRYHVVGGFDERKLEPVIRYLYELSE